MTRLEYILDKKYDIEITLQLLDRKNSENDKDNFLKSIGISQNFDPNGSKRELIISYADRKYLTLANFLTRTLSLYQDSWNEINDSFFAELEKLTEFKAAHNKFYCVLSIFNSGISNWGGDKVMRHWDRNPFTQRRITAHEIVISHFFSKLSVEMPEIQNKDQIWRLAEILAFTITGLDKKIQSYWPWDESGSFTDHNYPEIVPLQAELGEIFLTHGIKKFISHGLTKFN